MSELFVKQQEHQEQWLRDFQSQVVHECQFQIQHSLAQGGVHTLRLVGLVGELVGLVGELVYALHHDQGRHSQSERAAPTGFEKNRIVSGVKFWGCKMVMEQNSYRIGCIPSGIGHGSSGVGHGSSGVGHGSSGVGHGSSGVGHGSSGIGRGTSGIGRGTRWRAPPMWWGCKWSNTGLVMHVTSDFPLISCLLVFFNVQTSHCQQNKVLAIPTMLWVLIDIRECPRLDSGIVLGLEVIKDRLCVKFEMLGEGN